MSTVWENPGVSIDESRITAFERAARISLPDDYRRFLRDHNGALPVRRIYPIRESAYFHKGVIRRFLQLGAQAESDDLLSAYLLFRDVSPSVLPVAPDQSGCMLCISLDGLTHGRVVWWNWYAHMGYQPPQSESGRLLYPVADSFEALLELLEPGDGI